MRGACVLLHLLLLAAPAIATDGVFDSESGRACFFTILKDSGWSLLGPYEHAAFIVEQVDGSFECRKWRHLHSFRGESYTGVIPQGTVAIAHTHPVDFPYPSQQDKDEAIRLGMPIYVITIRGVYRADPQKIAVATLTLGNRWLQQQPRPAVRMAATAPEPTRSGSER
jgi:hypothetical protein